jgi:hypothetical protein
MSSCIPTSLNPNPPHFSERLSKAIEYLGFKARSHNAIAAHDHVAAIVSEQQKYVMYREMFPKEWKRSKASHYRRGPFVKYSERVNELFQLVNEKCFPLLDYWYDDPENEFDNFAIGPMNVGLCCEEIHFENLNISYAAGLIFYVPDDAWDFLNHRFHVSAGDFPAIGSSPHDDVWERDGNLFGHLLRLIDHSTGNPWLDSDCCQMADWFQFNRETIDELSKEYKDALAAYDKLKGLDELIEANPRKMLSALIDFWNSGKMPEDPQLIPTRGEDLDENESKHLRSRESSYNGAG